MRDKKRRLINILLTAAGAAICTFFSIPCAVTVVITSVAFMLFYEVILSQRRDQVMKLCDNIDRILRSDDIISFDEYKEGELSVLSAEIHKMTIRLREQNAELKNEKQFAKEALEDISHQLRTPLTSVMMILGLMRSSDLTDTERVEYLRDLYELLARMKWLIETMLSISSIEANAVKFEKNTVSCRELIEKSVEMVSVMAELKGVEIRTKINEDPEFIGDMHYTSEAVVNLLKNAIEHTPEGGMVTVSAKGSNIATEITITDTGEGIPEAELPHIFERFYRSSEYTKNGFGIGLAFAKKVISAQDGSLKASNRKPHGAVFDIHFYKTTI
ncbi:Signal transduction histidine kinase [Ruminococcus sp. YRD2003]|uniref:sensor histidine kinase n=1 Tax=Ruminococcus sp. YRD2003 TaxID=1452313 RepID=UPI0008C1017A|nr:Signal transduction histidine kinase [Ruminococcus flavefaciens]